MIVWNLDLYIAVRVYIFNAKILSVHVCVCLSVSNNNGGWTRYATFVLTLC